MNIDFFTIKQYQVWLKNQSFSSRSIKRKLVALKKYCSWLKKEKIIDKNPFEDRGLKSISPTRYSGIAKFISRLSRKVRESDRGLKSAITKLFFHLRYTRPKWYERYHENTISKYLNISILIIFAVALGIFGYEQFIKRAERPLAYPAATSPTTPNRYLSFQGRLTDSSDNPITVATDMRFALYNDSTASGSAQLWEEQRVVTPDEDGIFSIILGTTNPIPTSVFTDNANLWLGVTVETDPEMTPRQQIATVGYALNAETLQGIPPSASPSANRIPIITQSGDLVLAGASPLVYSTSGTFGIKGQAITISTDTGTNGNIVLAPDGTGVLNINLGGSSGNQIRVTDANITSGNFVSVYAGTDSTGFDLLSLSAGASEGERFRVTAEGDMDLARAATIAGSLKVDTDTLYVDDVNNRVGIGTTTPSSKLEVLGTATQLRLAYDGSNYVDFTIASDGDLLLKPTSTGQLKFQPTTDSTTFFQVLDADGGTPILNIDATNERVGIGTTNPTQELEVAGDIWLNNGQLQLGNYATNPTAIGEGSLIYNTTDDKLYYYTASGWVEVGSGAEGSSYWQRNLGALSPLNITDDLLMGATATSSALIRLPGISGEDVWFNTDGNVGIGTTSPDEKLDVAGNVIIGDNDLTNANGFLTVNRTATISALIASDIPLTIKDEAGSTVATLNSDGNLDVEGTLTAGSGNAFSVDTSGNLTAFGTFTGNIIATTDSTYDLGASGTEWANLYVDSITAGGMSLSGDLDMNSNLILNIGDPGTDFTTGGGLTLAGTLIANGQFTLGDGGDTGAINTSDWDISTSGAMTGIASITGDAGGMTITGGTGSGDDLLLVSTSDATKGDIQFHSSSYLISSTGDLTIGGRITFENSEYLANETDDLIAFVGAGGTDNTDLYLDLNGSYPVLYSNTDTQVGIDDDLIFVGAQTITTSTGNLTIDTAGSLVISDATDLNNTLDLDISSATALTVGDGSADTLVVDTSGDDVTITGDLTVGDGVIATGFGFLDVNRAATISALIASDKPLVVNGVTGQSANILEVNSVSGQGGDYLVVNSSGNVGIGTTDPQTYKLYVNGDTYINGGLTSSGNLTSSELRSNGNIYVNYDGPDGDSYLYFYDGTSTTGQYLMWNDAPGYFVLSGALKINGDQIYNSGGTSKLNLSSNYLAGGNWFVSSGSLSVNSTTAPSGGALYVNGNVGIGTTSPEAPLHIAAGYALNKIILVDTANEALNKWAIRTRDIVNGDFAIHDMANSATRFYIKNDGNIGIGTTNPNYDLSVSGEASISANLMIGGQLQLGRFASNPTAIGKGAIMYNSTNDEVYYWNGASWSELGGGLWTQSGNDIYYNSGNVGIGNTDPQYTLDVNGQIRATSLIDNQSASYYVDPNSASNINSLSMFGNLTLTNGGTIDSTNNGDITIQPNGSGQIVLDSPSASTDVCVGASGVCGGKLDAGTIDPPYTINGNKYSTYMPSMTGVKEETTGLVTVDQEVEGIGYRHVIDFTNLEEGSDLWLFSKITDLKNNIDKMVVLLSPSKQSKTWYHVDQNNLILSIYSSKPTTVSYRLTAPRFDWEKWTNRSVGSATGFIINDQLTLNNQGEIQPYPVSQNQLQVFKPQVYDGILDQNYLESFVYQVVDQTGHIIYEINSFAKITAARLKAGLLETTNLITENLVGENGVIANFSSRLASIDELYVHRLKSTTTIISPLVETENLVAQVTETEMIKPIADEDLIVQIQDSRFKIQDENQKELLSLDNQGNATFSGQLTAKEGQFNNITVEQLSASVGKFGQLMADKIFADSIEGLEAKIASVAANSYYFDEATPENREMNFASPSAELWSYKTNVGSYLDVNSIDTDSIMVNDFLAVFGQATITNLEVTNSLSTPSVSSPTPGVGEGSILYIQPSGLGGINMLAGKFVIDESGDIHIQGDVYIAGKVQTECLETKEATVSGSLFANLIKPIDGSLSIQLNSSPSSKFSVLGSSGQEVASIDASGSATFRKLNIATAEATSSGTGFGQIAEPEITTNATAGKTILPAFETEITIKSPFVTDKSLIYITPETDTQNQVLYVKTKTGGQFSVAINKPLEYEVKFNWWIIN